MTSFTLNRPLVRVFVGIFEMMFVLQLAVLAISMIVLIAIEPEADSGVGWLVTLASLLSPFGEYAFAGYAFGGMLTGVLVMGRHALRCLGVVRG